MPAACGGRMVRAGGCARGGRDGVGGGWPWAGERLRWLRVSATLGARAKTAGVSPEGNGKDAVSPTGSTQERLRRRVTKDKVAASGARLQDGQEAPGSCRPRTHPGGSRISRNRAAWKPLLDSSSRAVGGRARRKGCRDSFGSLSAPQGAISDSQIAAPPTPNAPVSNTLVEPMQCRFYQHRLYDGLHSYLYNVVEREVQGVPGTRPGTWGKQHGYFRLSTMRRTLERNRPQ